MKSEPQAVELGAWVLKIHQPEGPGPYPVIVMNHGWTGNEDVMWIFGARLPKDVLLIAPRAPYVSRHPDYGGYSWVDDPAGNWSSLDDFRPAVAAMDQLLDDLSGEYNGDFSQVGLVGFSQGAALSYAYALLHPDRVSKLAGLAGFLPERCEEEVAKRPLAGKSILLAHGSRDETVPPEMAEKAAEMMRKAGGEVRLCVDDVGHKLGSSCFRELKAFFGN